MSQNTNPYLSPATEDAPPVEVRLDHYRAIFFWERWRVAYNAVLAVAGFLAIATASGPLPEHFEAEVIAGAMGANLCYCLGPIMEAYLVWFGLPQKYARWGLLLAGTLFSAVVAFGGTAAYLRNLL